MEGVENYVNERLVHMQKVTVSPTPDGNKRRPLPSHRRVSAILRCIVNGQIKIVRFYTQEELGEMKKDDLKTLAKKLNVRGFSTKNKDDLIDGILARSADGRSEQRAMLDM